MDVRVIVMTIVVGAALLVGTNVTRERMVQRAHRPDAVQSQGNPATVRLYDIAEARFFCSGAVISDNLIVTAAHCMEGHFLGIEVRNQWGKPAGAWVEGFRYEGRSDQAILMGNFTMFKKLPIVTAPQDIMKLLPRNKMIACGFPYAGPLYCTNIDYKGIMNFQFAGLGAAWPGMSGGPVIDTETGYIVGVITAMSGDQMILSPTINLFYNLGLDEVK